MKDLTPEHRLECQEVMDKLVAYLIESGQMRFELMDYYPFFRVRMAVDLDESGTE